MIIKHSEKGAFLYALSIEEGKSYGRGEANPD